jgi:hypothetical protein
MNTIYVCVNSYSNSDLISRSEQRPDADLYGFNLPEHIPYFPLPLKNPEESIAPLAPPVITIKLQNILEALYDRAGYEYCLDYQQPFSPPALSPVN